MSALQSIQAEIDSFFRSFGPQTDLREMSAWAYDIHTKLRDIVFADNTVDSGATAAPQQACVREDAKKCLDDFMGKYNEFLRQETLRRRLESYVPCILEKYGTDVRQPVETNFGRVHFCAKDNICYAIKVSKFNPNAGDDPGREARWYTVVSKDGNPTMLPCIESFALGNKYVCVTPAASLDNLLDYLNRDTDKTKLPRMFADLLFAMSYLHNHMRVAHLDLKPQNVFLGGDNQVIVGDFGVALAVANAEREPAKQNMLQKLESKLQRRGASAQEIEQRREMDLKTFDKLYNESTEMQRRLSDILGASHEKVQGSLARLPRLAVPLSVFFRSSFMKEGFTYDAIQSINGYTDSNNSRMSGDHLMSSFRTYLSNACPNEADQKRKLSKHTVTLKPNCPAKLYVLANASNEVLTLAIRGSRGTEQYMCPVLWSGRSVNPFAADVYSLGVILYIFATGCQPYKSTMERAFFELREGGVAHLLKISGLTDRVHPTCLALLEKMMHFDPKQRPTIDECISEFDRVLKLLKNSTVHPFV